MKKTEKIILAVLVLLAGAVFLLQRLGGGKGATAIVKVENNTVLTLALDSAQEGILQIDGGKLPVTLEVKNKEIAFVHALCPDKVCEHTGFIGKHGQQATCLPARVSVQILAD